MARVEAACLDATGLDSGVCAYASVDAQQSTAAQYRCDRVHARSRVLVDGQFRFRCERLLGAAVELAYGAISVAWSRNAICC